MEERSPGLLLQAIPYLGKQKILKVFTPGFGVVSLMAKKTHSPSLLTPFCLADWVYKKGNRDLHVLLDGSISDELLSLRTNYQTLCAAGQIAQDLLKMHMPGAYCPELFVLASVIFQQMPSFAYPENLVVFFRLKWLQQEGLIVFRSICSLCGLPARHLYEGQSYCSEHALEPGWTFSEEEWMYIERLLKARKFAEFRSQITLPALDSKVEALFQEAIR